MNTTEQLGTFSIDVNQEHQQDLFDLEFFLDQLVDSLLDENAPIIVWDTIAEIRRTVDNMEYRAAITPSEIKKFSPITHQPDDELPIIF